MEELSWILDYLGEELVIPVILSCICYHSLRIIHLFYDSRLTYSSKIQEIKSNERIEKKKIKAIRKKKKEHS